MLPTDVNYFLDFFCKFQLSQAMDLLHEISDFKIQQVLKENRPWLFMLPRIIQFFIGAALQATKTLYTHFPCVNSIGNVTFMARLTSYLEMLPQFFKAARCHFAVLVKATM